MQGRRFRLLPSGVGGEALIPRKTFFSSIFGGVGRGEWVKGREWKENISDHPR